MESHNRWQGKKGKTKLPLTFRNAYPTATCEAVTPGSAMGFLGPRLARSAAI